MKLDKDPASHTVYVTIARVGSGGNALYGTYHYSFLPNIVNATCSGTRINYQLCDLTVNSISLCTAYVNAMVNEAYVERIADDRRSLCVYDANEHHQLIMLSLRAYDSAYDVYVNCDPQITNTPET